MDKVLECKNFDNEVYPLKTDGYLDQVVLPMANQMLDSGIEFIIRTFDIGLVICSNAYAKNFGLNNYRQIVGKEDAYIIERLGKQAVEHRNKVDDFIKHTPKLLNVVIVNNDKLSMSTIIPLLNNGMCFGFQTYFQLLGNKLNLDILALQKSRFNSKSISLQNISQIKFTNNEEIILSLLIHGYTQKIIADYMKVSRAYIAKVIAEGLSPKLNLPGASGRLVVDKSISLGLHNFIPRKLLIDDVTTRENKIEVFGSVASGLVKTN